MKTDAEWKELYDNLSASEYYEERWKDAAADLSAAREQLAEMREGIEEIRNCLPRRQYAWQHIRYPHARMRRIAEIADALLSAAPAGGRVVWRETCEAYPARTGRSIGLDFVRRVEQVGRIYLPRFDADLDKRIAAIVTVKEVPASADEEWLRECPRCGAAGGSELGPCPMCKGAGFVDEE